MTDAAAVPQVGDDGSNGAGEQAPPPIDQMTEEQIADLRAASAEAVASAKVVASEAVKQEDKPIIVDELDRAKAENLHLKALIAAYKLKSLQDDALKAQQEMASFQEQILQSQSDLSTKYGINLQTHEIRGDDGMVVPRGGNGNFGALMQRLAAQPAG